MDKTQCTIYITLNIIYHTFHRIKDGDLKNPNSFSE